MKKSNNLTLDQFNNGFDRMAQYLQQNGYAVQNCHLHEAIAKFEGFRNWRTMRAALAQSSGGVQPVHQVPQLNRKFVTVLFDVQVGSSYGEGPTFCTLNVSQSWLDRAFDLQQTCLTSELDEACDTLYTPEWDDNDTYRIRDDELHVTGTSFWFSGRPKHVSYQVFTQSIDLEEFAALVTRATTDVIHIFSDEDMCDEIAEFAGFEPEQVQRFHVDLISR